MSLFTPASFEPEVVEHVDTPEDRSGHLLSRRSSDLSQEISDMGPLFTPDSHRHALVTAYPELDQVCDQLGFGSELCLGAWSSPPEWALLLLARSAKPPIPAETRDWSSAEISELVDDLIEHHHRPLRDELQRMTILIEQFDRRHPEARFLLGKSLARLTGSLLPHLGHEERVAFPQCLAIEAASRGHGAWTCANLDVTASVRIMMAGHDDVEIELARLISLCEVVRAMVADPDLEVIGAGLAAMSADLVTHAAKERDILVPAAIFAEEQLRVRRGLPAPAYPGHR